MCVDILMINCFSSSQRRHMCPDGSHGNRSQTHSFIPLTIPNHHLLAPLHQQHINPSRSQHHLIPTSIQPRSIHHHRTHNTSLHLTPLAEVKSLCYTSSPHRNPRTSYEYFACTCSARSYYHNTSRYSRHSIAVKLRLC